MKKEMKIALFSVLFLISGIGTYYLYYKELISYSILAATVCFIFSIIILLIVIFYHDGEKETYLRTLRNILKVYDTILVETENIPEVKGKNVIRVVSIKELVDAQLEIRKPIFYKIHLDSCSFVLLDQDQALVFILKMNDQVVSFLEADSSIEVII